MAGRPKTRAARLARSQGARPSRNPKKVQVDAGGQVTFTQVRGSRGELWQTPQGKTVMLVPVNRWGKPDAKGQRRPSREGAALVAAGYRPKCNPVAYKPAAVSPRATPNALAQIRDLQTRSNPRDAKAHAKYLALCRKNGVTPTWRLEVDPGRPSSTPGQRRNTGELQVGTRVLYKGLSGVFGQIVSIEGTTCTVRWEVSQVIQSGLPLDMLEAAPPAPRAALAPMMETGTTKRPAKRARKGARR